MRLAFAIFAAMTWCLPAAAQQVLSFDSVTNLLSRPNPAAWSQNGKSPLRINGYLAPGDWGAARDAFWVRSTNLVIWGKTNSLSTNRGAFFQMPGATNGFLVFPDCYVGTPDIDPRWFGMPAPELYPDIQVRLTGQRITNNSLPAMQAATDFISERGGGIIRMPAGMFRWGSPLLLKPDVHIKGAKRTTSVQFDAGPVNVGLSHGLTVIFGSFGNTNYLNANGLGFPLLLADGPRFYTNKTTQSFVNFAGDTINYYRGGNTIEDLVLIPEYAWAWNGTNYPSAGFVFNEVANMEIKGCAIYGAFAPGGYIRGCLGYRVFDNLIQANWIGGLFVTDCSDGIIQGNRFPSNKGFGVAIYKANSHRLINNEYWNPTFDVVRYTGATTSVTNANYVSAQLNVRSNFVADPVTDTISVAVGSDTGMPVEIGGTDLPGGLATNTVYFIRSSATVTNGQNYSLYLSSGGAFGKNPAATPVDITSSGGTNTWWVQSPTHTAAMVWARAAEEIYIHDGRADMPINKGFVFQDVLRGQINGVDQWDMGREAKLEGISIASDDDVVGIHLIDTHGIEVIGNTLNANKYFSGVFPRDYIGLRMQGAVDTTVVGNFFDRMAYGIEADATSTLGPKRPVDVNNFGVGALRAVVSDSLVTTGAFSGVLLKKTNNIAGTIPAAHTNVTEFAIAVKFQLSTNLPNNGQEPIVHLTSSTNLAAPAARTPYSLTAVQYFDGSSQTDFIYLRMFGATTNDWRDWYASVGEMRGKHIEMVFERSTNGTMALYVDGWQRTLSQGTAGAGAAITQALWAPYLVVGGYDVHVRSNWVYGLSYARGTNWSADAINKGKPWATPHPAIVALWTFEGASTNGVWDLSGNGVHGRLNSLATAQAPTWGPDPSYRVQAGTGITVTRVGPLVDEIAASTQIPDGDKGDITLSGSGSVMTVDSDAVTYAKIQNVSAASRLLGRGSASGAGDTEEITLGSGLTMTGTTLSASGGGGSGTNSLGINSTFRTDWNLTNSAGIQFDVASVTNASPRLRDRDWGDVTTTSTGSTITIDNDAVTYAKIQNVSAASRLLGRGSASGSGDTEEITLGSGLTMSGTTLSATGGGGGTNSLGINASFRTDWNLVDTTGIQYDVTSVTNAGVRLKDRDWGDVTTTSTGSTITIDNDAVTYAKIQNVSAASRLLGRGSAAGSGDTEEITLGSGLTMSGTTISATGGGGGTNSLGINASFRTDWNLVDTTGLQYDVTSVTNAGVRLKDRDWGDVTTTSTGSTITIDNDAVTYAKMQNVSAASKLLGRGSAAGSGDAQEITLGSGLSMSGTTLSATGGSSTFSTNNLGYLDRNVVLVTNTETGGELTHYTITIPGNTLGVDGDEVEIHIPGTFNAYTTGTNSAYSFRWSFDSASGGADNVAVVNMASTYFTQTSTDYSLDWILRIKRIDSNTVVTTSKHFAGTHYDSGSTNNLVSAVQTGWFDFDGDLGTDPADFSLMTDIVDDTRAARLKTFGYLVAKVGSGGSGSGGSAHMQIAHFTALDNQPPASNYATFATRNSFGVLEFDPSTEESARGVAVVPEGADLGGGLKFKVTWTTAATSGDGRWGVQVMRLNTDIDSDSFDTAAEATTTCNATSGTPATTTITLTNIDGLVAGEPFAFKLYRDTSDAADTINSNDLQMMVVDITTVN